MTEKEKKRPFIKWVIVGLIAVVIASFALGYSLSYFFKAKEEVGTSEKPTEKPLTIASFEKEILDGDVAQYLNLVIDGYGVVDNTVWCKGTLSYIGPEAGKVEGAKVAMYITGAGEKSVNVRVVVYGGLLLLPSGTIDSDSVSAPTLGGEMKSFSFSLSCNYK
jgi:hypothetical protein